VSAFSTTDIAIPAYENRRIFNEDALPPVLDPPMTRDVSIDVPALVRQIREVLQS
jgi:hypothetical protein